MEGTSKQNKEEDVSTGEQNVQISSVELQLEERVKQDPFNTEAWESLADVVIAGKNIRRIRSVMDRTLNKFPLASSYWVRYALLEDELGSTENVRIILRRSLELSFSVDVWKFYLTWLTRTTIKAQDKVLSPAEIEKARIDMKDAFESAIEPHNIGWAMDSAPIWKMYFEFLEEMPEEETYDFTQKLDLMRKLYKRAVTIPIRGLEQVWKDYQTYEKKHEEKVAKQILDELQPAYQNAHEVLKERETYWRTLLEPSPTKECHLPRRPSAANNYNNVEAWNRMLAYEKTNPENLKPVDFKIRVRLSYRRAIKELWFHAEVWYSFFDFERSMKDDEASFIILRKSLHALPNSSLLHFCLADALELHGNTSEARELHDRLLERNASNAAFIQRMRFARRVEGKAEARDIFRRARAWSGCDSSIYCAAAEIEFRTNKDSNVARRILDLGLRRFPKDTLLAHRYLDLMSALNDYSASRDVFERILHSFESAGAPAEEIFPIWERYREMERDYGGDLSQLTSVEHRMLSSYPSNSELDGISSVLHRYFLHGTAPSLDYLCTDVEQIALSASSWTRVIHTMTGGDGLASASTKADSSPLENQGQASKVDSDVPPFLKKLVSILPRKVHINSMDVDFVIRSLDRATLPPPPTVATSGEGSNGQESVEGSWNGNQPGNRKRNADQLGISAAPQDAFKQRQKRNRG